MPDGIGKDGGDSGGAEQTRADTSPPRSLHLLQQYPLVRQ